MSIDVRGVHAANRGAQLMLRAVAERLAGEFDVSSNPAQGSYAFRARLGLGQTLHHLRYVRSSVVLGDRVPASVARKYGLVRDRDITGVLDASGFAYSDSFSLARHQREARFGAHWAKRGVPRVLLPQAFGPFTDAAKAALTKQVLDQSALVFARDDVSLAHVRSLGTGTRVERSVDFTIGLRPRPIDPVDERPFAALVPNAKLVASGAVGRAEYVELLRAYARAAAAEGLVPRVVVHESGDRGLAEEVAGPGGEPLFEDEDPLVLKAALGQASLVVASRFHAVVGALSQGVPTVSLGWSHKYAELLRDFRVPEWNATVADDAADRLRTVLTDADGAARLKDVVPELAARVESMWTETIAVLRRGR